MADLFWLSDMQWAAIEPLLPSFGGKPRVDDRRVISGYRFREGCSQTSTDRAPRCSTGSIGGPLEGCGRIAGCGDPPLVMMRSGRIAPQPAQKGAAKSGDRPLARRPHHQDPRAGRSIRGSTRISRGARVDGGVMDVLGSHTILRPRAWPRTGAASDGSTERDLVFRFGEQLCRQLTPFVPTLLATGAPSTRGRARYTSLRLSARSAGVETKRSRAHPRHQDAITMGTKHTHPARKPPPLA